MASDNVTNLNKETFDATIKGASGPVLVDFWAEWCGPCKMLSPVIDEVAAARGDDFKICKVDLEEGDNRDLAAQFGISGIPTLLFFKDGELKDRSGFASKDAIIEKLEALA